MSTDDAQGRRAESVGDLQTEQLLTDLDQTIGNKEQAIADNEQVRLDFAQQGLDAERRAGSAPSPADDVAFDRRQEELDLAEARCEIHQAQLDAAQAGRDDRQELLTIQQKAASAGPGTAGVAPKLPRLEAVARARGVRQRDKAARDRATEVAERSKSAE